jgi:hypothetical protein
LWDIYRNINEEIADTSEAVVSTLKKTYSRKSRVSLR